MSHGTHFWEQKQNNHFSNNIKNSQILTAALLAKYREFLMSFLILALSTKYRESMMSFLTAAFYTKNREFSVVFKNGKFIFDNMNVCHMTFLSITVLLGV